MLRHRLGDILPELCPPMSPHLELAQIECHSGKFGGATPNSGLRLFFAMEGPNGDGHRHVSEAIAGGAHWAVVETERLSQFDSTTPTLGVRGTRRLWSLACRRINGCPDRELDIFAVTGTDGKTTCTHALQHLLGEGCGRIGTVDKQLTANDPAKPSTATTANAADCYAFLAAAKASGCSCVALEMSSHALAQERLWGMALSGALFTNLSPEHGDFHHSMWNYFAAKARLFGGEGGHFPKICAIRCDCFWGKRMLLVAKGAGRDTITYGLGKNCQWRLLWWSAAAFESTALFDCGGKRIALRIPLMGKFNCINILGAMALLSDRIPLEILAERAASVKAPSGRMEPVVIGGGAIAFVDYAHTAAALGAALAALRDHFPQKLILVVFGCGGDRYRGKRIQMGAAAEKFADFAILTADNPRSERAADICEEICGGFRGKGYAIVLDRREAIGAAVAMAIKRGGVLLVAGKGHEKTQMVGSGAIYFDDRAAIAEAARGL
ncbi:MAG: UDP-N-acetylmuramoyl-L-alanyl-D-glutamate--2,6-diaminopimelate ligase [Puniceicoccales bacterium]|nr:UDP-N-acetylmuramoyl-L-alanyl-D-glutamate--2,6-diaminopimelate ligase [Puniceicoccales bacterium]